MTADYRPALTIRQPWASLIAAGVKTIETRPRRTAYRGRVAIHAALDMSDFWRVWDAGHQYAYGPEAVIVQALAPLELDPMLGDEIVPTGVVVASAVLTDCVQVNERPARPLQPNIYRLAGAGLILRRSAEQVWPDDIADQLPYGDYRPGRWALLLDDIKATTDRCPWCWGEGGWGDGSADQCWCCLDVGRCDPIPAKGNQAVPWRWRP